MTGTPSEHGEARAGVMLAVAEAVRYSVDGAYDLSVVEAALDFYVAVVRASAREPLAAEVRQLKAALRFAAEESHNDQTHDGGTFADCTWERCVQRAALATQDGDDR